MPNKILEVFKKIVLILLILVFTNLLSAFFWGFILSYGSSNIEVLGFNAISFDPLITIAYMMLFYFLTLFYQPTPKAQYYLFLFTLFLSFTVSFIQGAIYLVLIYIFLRLFKII